MRPTTILPLISAASLANAIVLKRTTYPATCDNAQTLFSTSGQQAQVNTFCTAYLGIVAKIVTVTSTVTVGTATVTGTTYSTTTTTVTPSTVISTTKSTTTTLATTTPGAVTSTATVTSTAYLDNDGNTITLMRRDMPTELAKRFFATPAVMSGWARPSVSSACQCLNIQPSTITRTNQVLATATASVTLSRVILKTTTLATPRSTITNVKVNTETLVAPAPIQTASTTDIEQVDGCPPGTISTFLCPEGTGDDDGSMTANSQINCSVDADDGFSGACDYWNDDGSPAGSVLTMYDPNHPGDPAYLWSRNATYGDSPDDDCPTWADWTCAVPGGSRRRSINLVERSSTQVEERGAEMVNEDESHDIEERAAAKTTKKKKPTKSVKTKQPYATSTSATAASAAETGNGLHPFNSLFGLGKQPTRGGNYIKWSIAQGKILQT